MAAMRIQFSYIGMNVLGRQIHTHYKKELNQAVEVIRSLGIEENVRKQALRYAQKAEKSLAKYSGSAKDELIALLDFVVKRSV